MRPRYLLSLSATIAPSPEMAVRWTTSLGMSASGCHELWSTPGPGISSKKYIRQIPGRNLGEPDPLTSVETRSGLANPIEIAQRVVQTRDPFPMLPRIRQGVPRCLASHLRPTRPDESAQKARLHVLNERSELLVRSVGFTTTASSHPNKPSRPPIWATSSHNPSVQTAPPNQNRSLPSQPGRADRSQSEIRAALYQNWLSETVSGPRGRHPRNHQTSPG